MIQTFTNYVRSYVSPAGKSNDGRIVKLPAELIFHIFNTDSLTIKDLKKFIACKRFANLMSDSRFRDLFHKKITMGRVWVQKINPNASLMGSSLLINDTLIFKQDDSMLILTKIELRKPHNTRWLLGSFAVFAVDNHLTTFSFNQMSLRNSDFDSIKSTYLETGWRIHRVLHDKVTGFFLLYIDKDNSMETQFKFIDHSLNLIRTWNFNRLFLFLGLSRPNNVLSAIHVSWENERDFCIRRYSINSPDYVSKSVKFTSFPFSLDSNDRYLAVLHTPMIDIFDTATIELVKTIGLPYSQEKIYKPYLKMNESYLFAFCHENLPGVVLNLGNSEPTWISIGEGNEAASRLGEILTANYLVEAFKNKIIIYSLRSGEILVKIPFKERLVYADFKEGHYLVVQTVTGEIRLWGLKKELPKMLL